jgi:hypothetical protein
VGRPAKSATKRLGRKNAADEDNDFML